MNDPINSPTSTASKEELDRFGIERVPADVYLWNGYRYTHARDALAAARREAAK